MTAITATMVKDLREKTGAGMMDCKAALDETAGDMEAAVDWLRTKGLAKAAKKAGRVAAEGLIGLAADDKAGGAGRGQLRDRFRRAQRRASRRWLRGIAEAALSAKGDLDKLAKAKYPGGKASVADTIKEMIGSIGENMTLRRTAYLAVEDGRGRELHAQRDRAWPRQDRRHRRARVDRRRRGRSRAFGRRSPCISPPPIRKPSTSTASTRRSSSASARC